jgi:hypothetical protein
MKIGYRIFFFQGADSGSYGRLGVKQKNELKVRIADIVV